MDVHPHGDEHESSRRMPDCKMYYGVVQMVKERVIASWPGSSDRKLKARAVEMHTDMWVDFQLYHDILLRVLDEAEMSSTAMCRTMYARRLAWVRR